MRRTVWIAMAASLLLVACGKPETLVWIRHPEISHDPFQMALWTLAGLDRIESTPRYAEAIQGLFGGKGELEEAFLRDLGAGFSKPSPVSPSSPRLQLYLERTATEHIRGVIAGDCERGQAQHLG